MRFDIDGGAGLFFMGMTKEARQHGIAFEI